jgi:hypothetical protein
MRSSLHLEMDQRIQEDFWLNAYHFISMHMKLRKYYKMLLLSIFVYGFMVTVFDWPWKLMGIVYLISWSPGFYKIFFFEAPIAFMKDVRIRKYADEYVSSDSYVSNRAFTLLTLKHNRSASAWKYFWDNKYFYWCLIIIAVFWVSIVEHAWFFTGFFVVCSIVFMYAFFQSFFKSQELVIAEL